jgi:hypothetical protein
MGKDLVTTVIVAIAGGSLVVVFALVGTALEPKRLAGIFSAAPSIALAGLIVTVVAAGDRQASHAALGMVFGAAGFVAFSVSARPLLSRLSAAVASLLACCAWTVVAVGGYLLAFR